MQMLGIIQNFLLQVSLIVVLIFTYELFFAERLTAGRRDKLVLSALFGTTIILTMIFPIQLTGDIHVDLRVVPLLLGTLYGGRRTGVALAGIIIVCRLLLGFGPGFYTTTFALAVSMPAVLYFQRPFIAAPKGRKIRIAVLLSLLYGLMGSGSTFALKGTSAEMVRLHLVYLPTIVVSVLFSVVFREAIRGIVERNRQLQTQVKEAEIAFLRSQIRPHFLYNALNSIAELCVDEPRKAEALTLDLSQYLRRSFDFSPQDRRTTIRHELELVEAYLNIEQARFGDKLHVEYDIRANRRSLIPVLMLQPIVENAVIHGIRSSDLPVGRVRVSICEGKDGVIRFRVADNGIGMSEERLEEVLARGTERQDSEGVGLRNINRRLELLYGRQLRIESQAGAGTTVSFDIPAES